VPPAREKAEWDRPRSSAGDLSTAITDLKARDDEGTILVHGAPDFAKSLTRLGTCRKAITFRTVLGASPRRSIDCASRSTSSRLTESVRRWPSAGEMHRRNSPQPFRRLSPFDPRRAWRHDAVGNVERPAFAGLW
jgi:hypothetical protein